MTSGGIQCVSWRLTISWLIQSRSGTTFRRLCRNLDFRAYKDGDKWCLCVTRWQQALDDDMAPLVDLEATHESALDVVKLEDLKQYAAVATDNFD